MPQSMVVMVTFKEKVLAVVGTIPQGTTLTYSAVASLAGNTKAARAVASILKANKDPAIPCHRVVRSDGKPGGYNGLRGESKVEILREEGVEF
jgi:methylated-DNA-[protein]-cysteine S-methyltransferase